MLDQRLHGLLHFITSFTVHVTMSKGNINQNANKDSVSKLSRVGSFSTVNTHPYVIMCVCAVNLEGGIQPYVNIHSIPPLILGTSVSPTP